MFSFFEEIAKLCNLSYDVFNKNFKLINFGNNAIFVQKYKNIITFEPSEITIKLNRGIIKIFGEELKIKNMNPDSIIITGKINSLEVA